MPLLPHGTGQVTPKPIAETQAVKSDYYFQMFYDDLPIWGFIGKLEKVSKPSGMELRLSLIHI